MRASTGLHASSGRSLAGGLILGGLAVLLLALPIGMLLNAPSDPVSLIVLLAIPAMLTLVLCTGAVGVYVYDLDDLALRICGWTVLGLLLFTGILGGLLLYATPPPVARLPTLVLLINVAGGGAVLGFLIGLYDAHQRLLYRDLRAEYDRTLALSQRLSVLSRIMRHDLRNHLNVIVGHADRLQEETTNPTHHHAIAAIQHSGHTLMDISETIHQFTKLLSDPTHDDSHHRLDLTTALQEAVDATQQTHDLPQDTISVHAPETAMAAAPPVLTQAITELLDNAITHTPHKAPTVTAVLTQSTDDSFELTITDNGPGIPEHELDILDQDLETQLTHSTGLGLWLVRWAVTASGGHLAIDSQPTGTTARIHLPTKHDRPYDALQ